MLCDDHFGSRLTALRAQRGMSQAKLAETVGIAATQLHRYESGRVAPRPTTLVKLAAALGTTAEWLANGDRSDTAGQPGHDFTELTLRLPPDLRRRLEDEAHTKNRSLNSEVIARLHASLDGEEGLTQLDKMFLMSVVREMRNAIAHGAGSSDVILKGPHGERTYTELKNMPRPFETSDQADEAPSGTPVKRGPRKKKVPE